MENINAQYQKVLLWEKGFAQYNAVIDQAGYRGKAGAGITRKLNDAIRMMAAADYQGLIDLLGNVWVVRRALAGREVQA